LYRVTVLNALVVLTGTSPKLRAVADSAVGAEPVADSATVSGLLGALVVTVSEVAGTAPKAEGVTVSKMVQLDFALSVAPQVPPEMA